jgi:hypothetical protein
VTSFYEKKTSDITGVGGALQGNFGTGVQLKLQKHPNAYIAIK